MINTITLPPFKKMCVTIGNLPSSFMESMSYYEALCWMYNYLDKTVIPAINTEGEAITELQTAFVTLKNYVDNYFENLDVQEEINNKLDAMAEAGTLTDIIAQYLGLAGLLMFNTVTDMKSAENLVNGSFTKTYGFHSINDGGMAYYKIRTITNEDIVDGMSIISLHDNTLVAELMNSERNVKQFGAYGDGAHDDTIAIQACINKSNGNVYFPKGTYLVYTPLTLKSNINIIGENKGNTIIKYNTDEQSLDNHFLLTANSLSNINIENITLQGIKEEDDTSLPTNRYYYGLGFIDSDTLYVNNCIFKNFYCNGMSIRNSSNVIIENSCFENNNTNGVAFTRKVNNVRVINNLFKNNHYQNINFENNETAYLVSDIIIENNKIMLDENDGIASHWAICFISPSSDNTAIHKYSKITIKNNYIYNTYYGINLQYCDDINVENNVLSGCTQCLNINVDLDLGTNKSNNIKIINNKFSALTASVRNLTINNVRNSSIENNDLTGITSTSTSNGCLALFASEYVNIINNYIHDSGAYGINLYSGNNYNVYNNKIRNVYTAGVRIQATGNVYIHFDNNEIIDDNSQMTYTFRFNANLDYVIIERTIANPSTLYNSTSQLGSHCITRNNNGYSA